MAEYVLREIGDLGFNSGEVTKREVVGANV